MRCFFSLISLSIWSFLDLISKLTVFETVSTQAKLKMPWFFSSKEVSDRSKGVLRDMGLEHVSDLRVMGSGLSGGELKRVQVASELVGGDAPLILLDEPASGLDAQTSWRLFSQLRALASDPLVASLTDVLSLEMGSSA